MINRELPKNKEGELRLTSMWLKKRSEKEISPADVQKAIAIISERSALTTNEITAHYDNSMSNRILELGNKYLRPYASPGEVRTITAPIIRYYHEYGSRSAFDGVVDMGVRFFGREREKSVGFAKVIAKSLS